jgi:hypothetical protein
MHYLTDFSFHFPIPFVAPRHHRQNTFEEHIGHSSSVTSHDVLLNAFEADTHYFRLSCHAVGADVAAAAAEHCNRSSSGRVTLLLCLLASFIFFNYFYFCFLFLDWLLLVCSYFCVVDDVLLVVGVCRLKEKIKKLYFLIQ